MNHIKLLKSATIIQPSSPFHLKSKDILIIDGIIDKIEDSKKIMVQKIKDVIRDMILNKENDVIVKTSVFLSEKLNHNYSYLSNLFSEVTYTSIENYVILQKIEYTKTLLVKQDLSLTEIAYKLNYSSVAHLSKQFKNTTGITPSAFQRIVAKRKESHLQ